MDRFIADVVVSLSAFNANLKSNMDRFIASLFANCFALSRDLKSNMDRFIDFVCFQSSVFKPFKIQYG